MSEQTYDPAELALAELASLRSTVLDAFADLEATICNLLTAGQRKLPNAAHLGARVEALKALEGISQIAKANYPKRDKLAAEITELLPVRADIVHSRMKHCIVDGQPTGIFVNSQNAAAEYPACRILGLEDLKGLARTILRIRKDLLELGRVTNPASSPPPPSQDAAGGP